MSELPSTSPSPLESLRQQWLQHAGHAFDALFDPDRQANLVSFSQREELSCRLGQELTGWLLEQHVGADPAVRPDQAKPAACPKCGQPGQRVTPPGEPLPRRRVLSRAGEVDLARERWRCTTCRVVFFPLDEQLRLGSEGYSPAVIEQVVYQGSKAPSFQEAAADLRQLARVAISAAHVRRMCERVGQEWSSTRDEEVKVYKEDQLPRGVPTPPAVAAVMLDGGRVQTRADDQGRGVFTPGWKETKVACCLTLESVERAIDPQPQPPRSFLDEGRVKRLVAQLKGAAGPAAPRPLAAKGGGERPQPKRQPKRRSTRPHQRVRTVVATMHDSERFGWQMMAEVHRRRLDEAGRKACVCDGQKYNWTLYEQHLQPCGFVAILDIIHLISYLYGAACAALGKGTQAAWQLYQRWLQLAWSGQEQEVRRQVRQQARQAGVAPEGSREDDPRVVLGEAVGYLENNKGRMDYARYRRLGLPISSAPVESVIKQVNRRIKGSEKFWLKGGAEALLQVRAAYLSQDERTRRYWSRPRPRGRAVGTGRLNQRN